MFSSIITAALAAFSSMGYTGIIILMAIESSFIPLPSELVIPPAAYLASQGEMNIFIVILCGMTGSIIGAIFNYSLAYFLGRKIIYYLVDKPIARVFLLSRHKIERAEAFFVKHGKSSTFVGRLVPAVRHLISIPAGLAKMRLFDFILYTALGSALWSTVLALIGYYIGQNQEYFSRLSTIGIIIGVLFILICIISIIIKRKTFTKHQSI